MILIRSYKKEKDVIFINTLLALIMIGEILSPVLLDDSRYNSKPFLQYCTVSYTVLCIVPFNAISTHWMISKITGNGPVIERILMTCRFQTWAGIETLAARRHISRRHPMYCFEEEWSSYSNLSCCCIPSTAQYDTMICAHDTSVSNDRCVTAVVLLLTS